MSLSAGEIVRATIMRGIEQETVCGGSSTIEPPQPAVGAPDAAALASRFNVVLPLKDGRALAYNTLSGAFALWSPEEMATYRTIAADGHRMGAPEIRDFAKGGYAVSANGDELAELEQRYLGARFDPARFVYTIAPTTACNFACDYCFQGVEKPQVKMSDEVQDAFIAFFARQLKRLQQVHVTWYGGEPLMGLPTIRRLSRRMLLLCHKARVKYDAMIITNGYQLTPDVARELYGLRVTACQVTFDGPAVSHDQRRPLLSGRPTYETIAANLREVIDAVPMQIIARVNIDERNAPHIAELLDDLAARGFGNRPNFGVYFAPVEAITEPCHSCSQIELGKARYGELEAELYRAAVDRRLCGLPKPPLLMGNCQAIRRNGLLLAANGDLFKCWDTMHEPSLKVGSIFDTERLADDATFQRWINWTPFAHPVCRHCTILPICTGFCAYKFVHPDKTRGEAGSLPCPSWKFNFNERIFLRAEKMGLVGRDDIADEVLRTSAASVGDSYQINEFVPGSVSPASAAPLSPSQPSVSQ